MDYQTNSHNGVFTDMAFDNVKRFSVTYTSTGFTNVTLNEDGYYLEGELYKSIVKDENWQPATSGANPKDHTIEEFKDKLGRVVLKRAYNEEERHDTYYIYDDYGNLAYVLPPLVDLSDGVSADELTKLCYQYKYDHRNRLIEKEIPAKEKEYIVYDKLDRPVLTQDANLRAEDKWLFTKYDILGRAIYTGLVINTGDRAALQSQMDATGTYETRTNSISAIGGTSTFYTNFNYPNDNSVIVLTVNYYDDYLWETQNSLEANYEISQTGLELNTEETAYEKQLSDSWTNAGFITNGTIEGDGYIEYTLGVSDKRMMVGLSHQAMASQTSHTSINYRISTGANGNRIYVYNGSNLESIPVMYALERDTMRVERYGNQILFKKNGVTFHVITSDYTGTLVGSGCIIDQNAIIENIHIGYAVYGQAFTQNVKGLPTGGKVRTIGTNDWTISESYYDEKAQAVHITSKNEYLDTQDAVSMHLDFTGKVLESRTTHVKANNSPIVTVDEYVYDENSRLLYQTKQINGGSKELMARHQYDALGQLEKKQVGGTLPSISTYTNLVNISANGNTITKTGTTNAWDAALTTTSTITRDGYLSYQIPQDNAAVIIGLAETAGDNSYSSMDYAMYMTSWGDVQIYESGTNLGDKTTYFTGDIFKIERRGTKIYYLKNGVIFYVSNGSSTINPLMGDISIYSPNAKIGDVVLVDLEKELQEVDFTYNVRGWLKGINNVNDQNNDLFSFAIKYNDIADPTKQLFNGNISSTLWKTKGQDSSLKNYVYEYDALNRIKGAVDNTNTYNLSNINYDRNGNILSLMRDGHKNAAATDFGIMDNLSYQYNGNQLLNVTDASSVSFGFNDGNVASSTDPTNANNDYSYDDNGNMVKDKNKGISSISYNYLNIPTQITFDNGSTISYIYDATGVKLEKSVYTNTVVPEAGFDNTKYTYYSGNYIYTKNAGVNTPVKLTFFNSEEGYIEPQFDPAKPLKIIGFSYTYQYKDHLGNIRLSYEDLDGNGIIDPVTEIKEENHYYPFGLKMKGFNNGIIGRDHQYGYNGKEEQNELFLNWSDYGARNYDASLGRWMNIDPLAEKYYDKSAYNYTLNNPVFFIDPNGETVDVSDLMNGGTDEDKWLLIQLMMNLSEISGEKITTRKDENGNTVLTTDGCSDNSKDCSAANGYINNLLGDDSGVIKVKNNSRNKIKYKDKNGKIKNAKDSGSQAYPNGDIYLDANQIYSFQESLKSAGIDDRSMNTGFIFLHETLHTRFGASFYNSNEDKIDKDNYGRFPDIQGAFIDNGGPTVKRVNSFRSEKKGLSSRLSYSSWDPKNPGSITFEKNGNQINVPIVNHIKFLNSKKLF
ncbi:RHS repeat-associated core domain protein [Kordia sp. SMS9]|uniref:RHS repeat domain-containing protein n=1 Tax=Kordia sp. SMS9 TaxID=2282170 RepID=UPI000E0DE58B|nr:RHS repeat-associated core domain-containing protein [Kordia sp. SMS9]AXG71768.1 RHS repeat-associated core domain protein [Kordia sp. SMS9]